MSKFETGKTYTYCGGDDYAIVLKRSRCYITVRTRSGEHRLRVTDIDGDGCERAQCGNWKLTPEHEASVAWSDEAEAELAYYLKYRYLSYTPDPKVVRNLRTAAFELAFESGKHVIDADDVTNAIRMAA